MVIPQQLSTKEKNEMTYVNGAVHETAEIPPVAMNQIADGSAHAEKFSPERRAEIKRKLEQPFDPREIKWRVTATSMQQTKRGPQKRGQLIAYADQRAYTDRLNVIFGEWGWTRAYDVQVAQNFERKPHNDKSQSAIAAKVVVVSRVTIHELGTHTGVGEEWADDENAATRAEAQAFKRACACFGLGRYLYDLEKMWVDLDQNNRPLETPRLPEWACPSNSQSGRTPAASPSPAQTKRNRENLVQQELLQTVKKLCAEVGYSLSQFALNVYGGVSDPTRLGFAKLTTVCEKLTDLANGVMRLKKAQASLVPERYAEICRRLELASDSLDDIPNRQVLRQLLKEAESAGSSSEPNAEKTPPGSGRIGESRGRLLQAARKAAENPRSGWPRKLGEVILRASGGMLTLEKLKDLTDGDAATVDACASVIESGPR
jgi:hypothetical protein